MYKQQRVSVVIPALNEELSIYQVISGLYGLKDRDGNNIIDEVVVCDNGSTDMTTAKAEYAGARVVYEPIPGYGRACLKAIAAVRQTDIVLFIDADHAFYAHQAVSLLDGITQGADLAIGSRTLGNMQTGSLTTPQKLGNQLATGLIKLIWSQHVTDLGPYRAIKSKALADINMQDETFGWTIEMQIKAIQHNLLTIEVPVDTRCRIGTSKISGTIKGSVGAGIGILSTIAKHWLRQKKTGSGKLANENFSKGC